jgi:hypothetical protein
VLLLAFFLAPALEGLMETVADGVRKRKQFAIAIELDGPQGCVEHDLTMLARPQMGLDRSLQLLAKFTVEISRNLFDGFFATHNITLAS